MSRPPLSDTMIDQVSQLFLALGDASRLKILRTLQEAKTAMSQGALAQATGLPPEKIRVVTRDVGGSFGVRGGAYAADGTSYSETPYLLTDPWTSAPSYLIDLGEDMTFETYERLLAPERFMRLDCVIDCSVSEVIAA